MAAAVRDEVGLNTLSMHAAYGQKLVAILADSDIPNLVLAVSVSETVTKYGHYHWWYTVNAGYDHMSMTCL